MKIKMNKSVVNILIIVVAAIALFVILKYLNSRDVRFVPNVPLSHNKELFGLNDVESAVGDAVDSVTDKILLLD
jgi:hypothetical protein